MRRRVRIGSWILAIGILCGVVVLLPIQVRAADAVVGSGTAASCSEAAFDRALATALSSASGTITFNCGGPATILFTAPKTIRGPGFVPPARSVSIDGAGQITLSGGDAVSLFYIEGDTNLQALTLRRMTLSSARSSFMAGGGAIFNNGGALTLDQVTVQFSSTASDGGAILSIGPHALTISDSTLRRNAAGDGGAISSDSNVQITGSLLHDNRSTRSGGAISSAGRVELRNTQVISNTALGNGGGIVSSGVLTLTNSLVSENSALGGSGGGVFSSGQLVIDASTIRSNSARDDGGGLVVGGVGAVTEITRSAISQNTSVSRGGGIYSQTNLTITNSTLTSNTSNFGGAIYIFGARTTLRFVTLSGNLAGSGRGAGIRRLLNPSAPLALEGVVFDSSASGENCSTVFSSTPDDFSARYSLASDSSCFGDSGTNRVANPRLGPLAENGGPTRSQLPLPGSPLIDGAACPIGLVADQRGRLRPAGISCDMGAVERQPDEGLSKLFLPFVVR